MVAARRRRIEYFSGFAIFLILAIGGLFYVKWDPYFHKALRAAKHHSLGSSIVSGQGIAPPSPSLHAALSYAQTYFTSVWQALLLGLLLAATIETLVPRDWLVRVLGRSTPRAAALGGVLALPGMMCTCCTAPVINGLRRRGASSGSATAFFLGNPTLNPAVLVFLVLTLGWRWAALRLVLGVILVFGAALLIARLVPERRVDPALVTPTATPDDDRPLPLRWLRAFARLTLQLVPEYLIIVTLLGAARAFFFPASAIDLSNSPLLIIGFALAGMLFVIPTAGEIPIIQTMLAYGVGAGPAGALLLALAPVSLPSLAMVARVFPARALAILAGATVLAGLAAGLLALALGL